MRNKRAQNIMEYSIVLSLVASILVGMQVYLRRGIQAGIAISADQLGNQVDAMPITSQGGSLNFKQELSVGGSSGSSLDSKKVALAPEPKRRHEFTNPEPEQEGLIACSEWPPEIKYFIPGDETLYTYKRDYLSRCWNGVDEVIQNPDGTPSDTVKRIKLVPKPLILKR